jgi:HSP20 family protein
MAERRGLSPDFDHMAEHLEQMWDHLLGGDPGNPRFAPPVIEPPTDVYQTLDEIVVLIEIAGMRDQEVEIQLDGRRMIIRGVKLDRRVHNPGRIYNAMEIQYGPFERAVLLPADVDQERVAVQYDDGLLQITLPKKARQARRRVRITVH